MNVCMLVPNEFAPDPRVLKEARTLKEGGYEVEILAFGLSWKERHSTKEEHEGIRVSRVGGIRQTNNKLKRAILTPYYMLALLSGAYEKKADVYHCHDLYAAIIGTALKALKRKKTIYDAHEHYPSLIASSALFPKTIKPLVSFAVDAMERFACIFFDRVITVNETLRRRYESFGKKTTVLYNCPPLAAFSPQGYAGSRRLIHTGSMNRERGIDKAVAALKRIKEKVPEARFMFLGGIGRDPQLRKWVEEYAAENGLSENMEIVEWAPYEEVREYIKSADVGVILFQPTYYNNLIGLPNKLFEYMACSRPVIASDFTEMRRVIDESCCGICVDPTDPEKIAEAAITFLTDPEKMKKMGENGRKAVEEKYNWELMGKRLTQLYAGLDEK